jgi:hypothetical protein
MGLHRTDLVRAVERADVGGLLYGAVVCGGALAAISAHSDETPRVALSTFLVVVVYWLSHVYVHVLSERLAGTRAEEETRERVPGGSDGPAPETERRPAPRSLSRDFTLETGVLKGGLPALVVYVAASALGAEPSTAGFIALSALTLMLLVVGYLGAFRAGLRGTAAALEASGAGLFGLLMIGLKAFLH